MVPGFVPRHGPTQVLVVIRFPTTRFDSPGTPHFDETIGDLHLTSCSIVLKKTFLSFQNDSGRSISFLVGIPAIYAPLSVVFRRPNSSWFPPISVIVTPFFLKADFLLCKRYRLYFLVFCLLLSSLKFLFFDIVDRRNENNRWQYVVHDDTYTSIKRVLREMNSNVFAHSIAAVI